MQNKKKTNGTMFFILIPIFVIIASFVYDNVLMVVAKKNYRLATDTIIKDVLTNSYYDKADMVKKFYEDKNLEIEQLDVVYEDDILYIYNVHNFPAFFGRIFGVNSYRTEVNLKAYKNTNNEIIIEEVNEE